MLGGERCITHDLWEDLGAEIHAYLAAVSLEDVILRRTGARRRTDGALPIGAAA
jgi:Rrf2 family iron-sulfur cluster assembly transcriptional regulator